MNADSSARRLSDAALFGTVSVTVFLLSITIIALAFLRPGDTFRSSARIKLDFRSMEAGFNPEVLRAELPMINSNSVLRQVVQQLQLTNALSRSEGLPLSIEDAAEELKRIVVIRPIPNSMLIEIQALFGDPARAADIANAIAAAYQNDLLNRTIENASNPLIALEIRKRELADAVQAARLTLKQMEITNAPEDALNVQRATLAEAERMRSESASELERATSEFSIPKNTLRAVVVDQAIPDTRPVQTHRRRTLMVGIPGAIALGISAGAVAVVIRRSRGTTRFTPPKRT